MAGIINYTANTSPASQTPWNVDKNQTVLGQVENVIKKESPLQQIVSSNAMQQANKRGLIGTNMAVESANNAVLQNALQIATPDAQTYAAAGQTNATEANKIGTFNAGEANTTNRFNAELATKNDQFNIGEQNKIEAQKLDIASQEKLAANNIEFNKFAKSSEAGQQFFDTYQKSLNSILLNPDLSTEPGADGISPKQKALDMAAQTFQAGMTMHQDIAGLNLGSILSFDQPAGSAQATDAGPTVQSAVGKESTPNAALAARQSKWDAEVAKINAMKAPDEGGSYTRKIANDILKRTQASAIAALGPRPA